MQARVTSSRSGPPPSPVRRAGAQAWVSDSCAEVRGEEGGCESLPSLLLLVELRVQWVWRTMALTHRHPSKPGSYRTDGMATVGKGAAFGSGGHVP